MNGERYLSKILSLSKVGFKAIKTEINILTSALKDDNFKSFPKVCAIFLDKESEEVTFYYENIEYNLKYIIKHKEKFLKDYESFLSLLLRSLVNTCKDLYSEIMLLHRNIRPASVFINKDLNLIMF
jgi:hypothetical protein